MRPCHCMLSAVNSAGPRSQGVTPPPLPRTYGRTQGRATLTTGWQNVASVPAATSDPAGETAPTAPLPGSIGRHTACRINGRKI